MSPGSDVEVNVVPQVTLTTEDAINKFSPADRGCYACEEAKFRFMPGDPGRYLSELVFGAECDIREIFDTNERPNLFVSTKLHK